MVAMSRIVKLPLSFYSSDDVLESGRALLGKVLCSNRDGRTAKAMITETEAYAGINDRASHAYGNRCTARTKPMYAQGGLAYVYLCYGIHHLFNVVVGTVGNPLAILIRAGVPLEGIEIMRRRRNLPAGDRVRLEGPGVLSQALGITTALTGVSLLDDQIWIEDHRYAVGSQDIAVGPRIGIDYAGDDANRPYRFRIDMCVEASCR